MKNAKKEEIPQCVYDDEKFKKEIQKYTSKIDESRKKIGKLVHYYIQENGRKYGAKIHDKVAQLANLSVNTIRHYHKFYRLQLEFSNCANLESLYPSAQYQIARLMPECGLKSNINTKKVIPELIDSSFEKRASTEDVARMVTEVKRMAKKKQTLSSKEYEDYSAVDIPHNNDNPQVFTINDYKTLNQAIKILKKLSRDDLIDKSNIPTCQQEGTITGMLHEISRIIGHKVSKKEWANLETDITAMHDSCTRWLIEMYKRKEQQEQQKQQKILRIQRTA